MLLFRCPLDAEEQLVLDLSAAKWSLGRSLGRAHGLSAGPPHAPSPAVNGGSGREACGLCPPSKPDGYCLLNDALSSGVSPGTPSPRSRRASNGHSQDPIWRALVSGGKLGPHSVLSPERRRWGWTGASPRRQDSPFHDLLTYEGTALGEERVTWLPWSSRGFLERTPGAGSAARTLSPAPAAGGPPIASIRQPGPCQPTARQEKSCFSGKVTVLKLILSVLVCSLPRGTDDGL